MQHLAHSLLTGSHPEDAHGVEAVQLQVSTNIQWLQGTHKLQYIEPNAGGDDGRNAGLGVYPLGRVSWLQ